MDTRGKNSVSKRNPHPIIHPDMNTKKTDYKEGKICDGMAADHLGIYLQKAVLPLITNSSHFLTAISIIQPNAFLAIRAGEVPNDTGMFPTRTASSRNSSHVTL